jgi:hypothetical protein
MLCRGNAWNQQEPDWRFPQNFVFDTCGINQSLANYDDVDIDSLIHGVSVVSEIISGVVYGCGTSRLIIQMHSLMTTAGFVGQAVLTG